MDSTTSAETRTPTADSDPTPLAFSDAEIAIIAALVGAAVALLAMFVSRKTARQRATLDFIRSVEIDGDYQVARQSFIKLRDSGGGFCDEVQKNSEIGKTFRYILNTHELMAIGVRENILDDNLYHRWYRSTVLSDWKVTKDDGYIDYERSKRCSVSGCPKPCDQKSRLDKCEYNDGIFKEYELLATRWEKHKQPAHYPPRTWAGRAREVLRFLGQHKLHVIMYSLLILSIGALVYFR